MLCAPKVLFFFLFEYFLNDRFDLVYESLTISHRFVIFKVISAMGTFRFDKKGLFYAVLAIDFGTMRAHHNVSRWSVADLAC